MLVTAACLLPKYIYRYVQITYIPRDSDIVRELELNGIEGQRKSARVAEDLERQRRPEDYPLVTTPIPLSPTFQTVLQSRSASPAFGIYDSSSTTHPNQAGVPSSLRGGSLPPDFEAFNSRPTPFIPGPRGRSLPPPHVLHDTPLAQTSQRATSPYGVLDWGGGMVVPTIEVHGASPRGSIASQRLDNDTPSHLTYSNLPRSNKPSSGSMEEEDEYYDVGAHYAVAM